MEDAGMSLTIVWFRRDLRLADNLALATAAERGEMVLPVYLEDWEADSAWAPGAAARWWLTASLRRLAADLDSLGVTLQLLAGDPEVVLPEWAAALGAATVAWNVLYEPHSLALDDRVRKQLQRAGVAVRMSSGSLLFEPEEHLSRAGRPFVQFGAFWRSCLSRQEPRQPIPAPASIAGIPAHRLGTLPPRRDRGGGALALPGGEGLRLAGGPASAWVLGVGDISAAWQPGEEGAGRRLGHFVEEALAGYAAARDYPAVEGVSRLSPHLHFGEVSPRLVWQSVCEAAVPREARPAPRGGAGLQDAGVNEVDRDALLRQLGWREFAHYLLYHFPTMATEPFRREFSRFPWQEDPEGLAAWKEGATGFPLVDAGMQQLLAEGWMHNRVRMVVASFLTKDLLVPWQMGAAWFWDHLVDADLANNTLGWQWTAGCGPDAAPYFRVFNPVLQAQRFDAGHEYVERWLPDGRPSYAAPILDHGMARLRALEAFRLVRSR